MEDMVDTVEPLVVLKKRWNIDLQEWLYYGQNIEIVHVAVVAR